MLVFEEMGKPEYPEKNLSEQRREPTTNYGLGFWIPSRGFRITCQWNLDSGFLELNSGFQSPGVQIPEAKTSRIPEFGLPYMSVI